MLLYISLSTSVLPSPQTMAPELKRDLARSMSHMLRLALTDKVPGVYMAGVSLIRTIAGEGVLVSRDCAALVADVTPVLIEKVQALLFPAS